MTRSRALLLTVGLGSLGLLTACPIPASHYEIDVGPGEVLAADVLGGQFNYWILDSSGAIVEDDELVVIGAGSVTVHSTDAQGLYVTTPDYNTAPAYQVIFDGNVAPDNDGDAPVLSYLDTDEPGFVDLRTGTAGTMFDKHQAMQEVVEEVHSTWTLDKGLQSDALITVTHDEVTGAQSELQDGVSLLLDSDDLDAAEAGTSGLASWATGVQDEIDLIEPTANDDVATAQGEATTLSANAPDPAVLQAAIEDCLELEAWGDEIEASLDKAYPDDTYSYYKDEDYDGKDDDGKLERDWEQLEANLEAALENQEILAEDIELCVELAIAGEPDVDYTETDPTTYQDIGDNATGLAEGMATDAEGYLSDLENSWADNLDGDELSAWGALGWYDPAQHAYDTLTAEIGTEMFENPTIGATAYMTKGATAKDNSSFDACTAVTPVFQFDVAGLGVAIGTPFADTMRGNDVETGFEVMFGGKGDDCINGLKGHELIVGGQGDDEIHGGDQHELLIGGPGDDAIFAGEGESYTFTLGAVNIDLDLGSVIFGGAGSDYISGGDPSYDENDLLEFGYTDLIFGDGLTSSSAGEDEIDGGAGIDFLFGQWDDDLMRNRRPGVITINAIPYTIGSFHFGGKGDDELTGSDRFDLMIGSKDDDEIAGNGGLDLILCGSGDDIADGGDGLDLIFGGKGDDPVLNGGDGIDLVMGNSGDDHVNGGDGALDVVFGNSGDDTVSGDEGFDIVFGNSGKDFVNGNDGIDLLFGNSDNDTVTGGEGIDLAFGNSGRDWVDGGNGAADLLFGNAEVDVIIGAGGLDVIFGNDGDDWIQGNDGVDIVFAGEGDDVAFGGNDLDILFGSDGDDCVWGDAGVDFGFGGEGADQLVGGTELDLLVGSEGSDNLHGEDGIDFLLGGDGVDGLTSGNDLGVLFGGDDDDQIEGGAAMDLFFAGDGDDCMTAAGGFDISFGGEGDDVALDVSVGFGQSGDDDIETDRIAFGGDGADVVSQTGAAVAFVTGGDGADQLSVSPTGAIAFAFGGSGDDILSATGNTTGSRAFVFGGKDADDIQASRGRSFAFGQKGDDWMSGDWDGGSTTSDDRDRLWGNSDSDTMYGDASDSRDRLYRGSGSDPSRTWDGWPSGWGALHAAPSFGTCVDVPLPMDCDDFMEPPADVGAK